MTHEDDEANNVLTQFVCSASRPSFFFSVSLSLSLALSCSFLYICDTYIHTYSIDS